MSYIKDDRSHFEFVIIAAMGDTISYPNLVNNVNNSDCDYLEHVQDCEYLRNRLLETSVHARELVNDNQVLTTDCEAAHRRIITLEAELEFVKQFQNPGIVQLQEQLFESENVRHHQYAEIDSLKRRCYESETAHRLLLAENNQLKQQLCESETARAIAVKHAEEMESAHDIAIQQTTEIRVSAETAVNVARTKVQKLLRANASLNVRCGALMQQQAILVASMASVAHELDTGLGHARTMKRMVKLLSSMPAKQTVAAVRAARAEAREVRIRERSLAFARSALELANRAERHRMEYEQAFREEANRSLAAKAKESDAALNELRAEYRVVVAECATLRRRFADAYDDLEEARVRTRQLERTNSSLASQLGSVGEAARAASIELAIAKRTAAQSRCLKAKVARLRARCGELSAARADETEVEDEDTGDSGTVCVICLDVLAEGESVIRLDCSHVFHSDCITQCLSRMREPHCPLDRIPVTAPVDQLRVWNWLENGSPVSERLSAPPMDDQ